MVLSQRGKRIKTRNDVENEWHSDSSVARDLAKVTRLRLAEVVFAVCWSGVLVRP
jgi:hypothetical protein